MHIRKLIVIGFAVVATALSGCNSEPADDTDNGAASAPAVQDEGEGELVDVPEQLIKQGFKQGHLAAIQANSAYWLTPFQTPLEMSKDPKPGNVTCVFRMVNKTYQGKGAIAAHRIRLGSTVKLTAHVVGSDGAIGASLPKELEVKFRNLTPQWLAGGGADSAGNPVDLGVCGDLTVK